MMTITRKGKRRAVAVKRMAEAIRVFEAERATIGCGGSGLGAGGLAMKLAFDASLGYAAAIPTDPGSWIIEASRVGISEIHAQVLEESATRDLYAATWILCDEIRKIRADLGDDVRGLTKVRMMIPRIVTRNLRIVG